MNVELDFSLDHIDVVGQSVVETPAGELVALMANERGIAGVASECVNSDMGSFIAHVDREVLLEYWGDEDFDPEF